MDNNCVFCKIVKRELPASIIYEDDICLAFLDIYPITEGHTLLIPKKHFLNLETCDEDILKHLILITKKLNPIINKSVKSAGILNEVMNGEAAGQEIFHLHFHIIPRYINDGFGWFYPKGYREKLGDREKLNNIAKQIRLNL